MEIGTHRPRNVGWARAAALLYGDWGTSKAYVIGAAFFATGFSSFPIIIAVCAGTDGNDDGKRGKTGREKRGADDVGLARAPVAVEQRRRAGPADIAGPMCADFHCFKSV